MNTLLNTVSIQALVARGALFVVNHSGGKDSQAAFIEVLKLVPREQILVIHASLGEVEWHGALELAQAEAEAAGVPFIVAKARHKDGSDKTFFTMVEKQFARRPDVPSFPSGSCRTCTSDLKRDPITRETIAYMKAHGLKLVVNVLGLRADESEDRAKLEPFSDLSQKRTKKGDLKGHPLAKAGREAYEWLPIHDLLTDQVFASIAAAGKTPHWAYAQGNERVSCVFCIYGSKTDILNGALARPELFAKYVELEERTGYTMHVNRKLGSLTQIVADAQVRQQAA